jgi:hypothetical protein
MRVQRQRQRGATLARALLGEAVMGLLVGGSRKRVLCVVFSGLWRGVLPCDNPGHMIEEDLS